MFETPEVQKNNIQGESTEISKKSSVEQLNTEQLKTQKLWESAIDHIKQWAENMKLNPEQRHMVNVVLMTGMFATTPAAFAQSERDAELEESLRGTQMNDTKQMKRFMEEGELELYSTSNTGDLVEENIETKQRNTYIDPEANIGGSVNTDESSSVKIGE